MTDKPKSGNTVIKPGTGEIVITGFAPSIIIEGPDELTGDHRIKVSDPEITSESRKSDTGDVSVHVSGKSNMGRRGEPRLIKTLRQTLQAQGHEVHTADGRDKYGEDGIFTVDGIRYVLQVVTTPSDTDLWRSSAKGVARKVTESEAIGWLHTAIEKKKEIAEKGKIILAVDARHVGVLTQGATLETYIVTHGDPVSVFGFASVWIVGPTGRHCVRLGSGRP